MTIIPKVVIDTLSDDEKEALLMCSDFPKLLDDAVGALAAHNSSQGLALKRLVPALRMLVTVARVNIFNEAVEHRNEQLQVRTDKVRKNS